ncbi:MAG: integrin alpha [Pseudomonadota bacterium]|nr:integrin alpha [Pseudomonadota bacterium]
MRLLPLTVPLLLLPLANAATGGPDRGGVLYTDSDEPLGPSHAWLDATGGDAWPLGDDETVTIDLPFAFSFYGTERLEATISSNGVLFFTGASPLSTGLCPGAFTTWTGIAAYWDDLAASTVHTATYGTWPWRTFVVSWDNVAHATAGGSGRFQIWLLEGRSEAVVVLDDTTWGDPAYDRAATATIGVNSPTDGLPWTCSTAISDGSTIWFGDQTARPARAEAETDELEDPWTGQGNFDYAGRVIGTGDINGDGTDDLLVGTQDRVEGQVGLVYRPGSPSDLSNADATFEGEAADDDFGAALAAADLDGDGQDELLVGAPGNDGVGNRAGKIYLWEGGSWSGTQAAADALAIWTGPATGASAAGTTLATGDLDGDGYRDVVYAAPTADAGGTDAGAVYINFGSGLPSGTSSLSSADATLLGLDASDQLGGGALATGDLDGDGAEDLVVSALYADDGATNAGTVYVVAGGSLSGTQDVDAAASCSFSTPGPSARLGTSLLLADIDGSGVLDLFVGASTADVTYSDSGTAYGVYDPGLTCIAAANLADAVVSGTAGSANLGSALASGDLDGDGTDDLVVSAPNRALAASGGGAAYVFTTAPLGSVDTDSADHAIGGSGSAAALGTGLVVAANASGLPTLFASAPYDTVAYASEGAIYEWTYAPDFLDGDGDGFVSIYAGGNDCDDDQASAYPAGTDTSGDSLDGDCDGWVDGVVRVRDDAEEWAWDLDAIGGGATDRYDFESYAADDDIATYGDLTFAGDLTALGTVYGTAVVDTLGARLLPGATNTVGIAFADPVDALALRVLDPSDDFTLVATGPAGDVVTGYTFALAGDDRTSGVYRAFTFVDEVTAITLTGATSDGFGLDAIEVAWSADSDRDGDGFSDADGDCDDTDGTTSPDAAEDLADGVDNDCDGIVDAGDATAYTDAADWAAAAALDATSTIDFEVVGAGETILTQYFDDGVAFDGALVGATAVDGTPPHGTIGARLTGSSTRVVFTEDQPAIGLYVLDGDALLSVDAYDDGVLLYSVSFTPTSADAFYGLVFDVSVDELVIAAASDTFGLDDLSFSALGLDDADGDGQTERDGDCDDTDATTYDGAPETWYDGVDADCAEDDDYDADADGSDYPGDCDDEDPATNPTAADVWYDGVDSDCDGASDYDADRDGHDDIAFGGLDCDDTEGTVNPDATEVYYDGVDADCAGDDDDDADGDGFPIDTGTGTLDCDDTDGAISPDATETYYDGVDSDCSGETESDYDADGDGYDAVAWGGDDCEDAEPTAYPGAVGEVCYDSVDTDCGGEDDNDCDGDGYASDAHGGDDCDDGDTAVNPAAADSLGDGLDTNCDGSAEYDFDYDGYDGVAYGGADCDDADAAINPAAIDTCYDGVDTDCDAWDDNDCDLDGYASDLYGGADCDDTAGAIHPDATDFPYDGVDQDCGGESEYDLDGDGHATAFYGGDDCDDADATVYAGAPDTCYDGVDSDCGGGDDDDCDGDGHAAEGAGGDDCDDGDAGISPTAAEIEGDGIDQDCDGSDIVLCTDCDGDGYDADLDCDDTDATSYPGAPDPWYDGVDGNCDGANDFDADVDGADAIAWGGGDCDDSDAAVSPANTVDDCGGGDEDCDGESDEDCDYGEPPEDTGTPRDTGPVIADTATRDTAVDWRPDPSELVEPDILEQDSRCGCSAPGTSGTSGAGTLAGLALAGLALGRRRRG